ncbi:hypothetical protein [Hominenteromicrobium sp.]|jgi:hypothetical protein|uniref:hypothetical protein n=1 Tax=Hominenteromicrobium sp. TaxID=3073581 RepID=UPI00206740F4|nr:MAG TPA: hypothetical protein [Caudoviricetes sp.]
MRYYAEYDGDTIIAVGTGFGGTEITEDDYKAVLAEIEEKRLLADRLYAGEITIEDVPEKWRTEVQQTVDNRRAIEAEEEPDYEKAWKILIGDEV